MYYQRDSTGSKLFISFKSRTNNVAAYHTAIVSGEGIKVVSAFPYVWYDDSEMPVFWIEGFQPQFVKGVSFFVPTDDSTYVFRNGSTIPYKAGESVKGVSGADLVMIGFRDKPGWIVSRPENPQQALIELPDDFEPTDAYSNTNGLVIFGNNLPARVTIFKCLIYQQFPTGYKLIKEIIMPGGVYDMAPGTDLTLIQGEGHFLNKFPSYYRFNLGTKHRARLGFAPSDDVLFLKEDVVQTLESALKRAQ
jgi:hypothetical protein